MFIRLSVISNRRSSRSMFKVDFSYLYFSFCWQHLSLRINSHTRIATMQDFTFFQMIFRWEDAQDNWFHFEIFKSDFFFQIIQTTGGSLLDWDKPRIQWNPNWPHTHILWALHNYSVLHQANCFTITITNFHIVLVHLNNLQSVLLSDTAIQNIISVKRITFNQTKKSGQIKSNKYLAGKHGQWLFHFGNK